MNPTDRAAQIMEHKRRSHSWLENSFYAQWEQVYKAYLCERPAAVDPNTGQADKTKAAVGAPDTWASTNRFVARVTAQAPNLRFRCNDPVLSELISRTLMMQWDKAGIQRIQKKHVRQGALLGWSVRPWYWEKAVFTRRKRVVPEEQTSPEALAAIQELYGEVLQGADVRNPAVMAQLVALQGRGGLLPVEYPYVAYQGPKADFLFIGDVYPEPAFQSIQASRWLVVERRRDRAWMMAMARAIPEMAKGIADLLSKHPNGSPRRFWGTGETGTLRQRLSRAVDQDAQNWWQESITDEWTITEEHVPGPRPKLALVGEDTVFLGEIDYPYDLDGKIAFSELLFVDNLLHGVGDSSMRVLRGIQELHSKMMSRRADMFDYGMQPLAGTSDLDLYENPKKIRPMGGWRIAYMPNGPNSFWWQDSSAVLNAARSTFEEEANYARQWQAGAGDSNISMMAGVDPQQSRTATGAKLLSAALDTLTRDGIDMFTQTSLRDDAEFMYLLNRSELADAVEFDASGYKRVRDSIELKWVKVEPLMFQRDGEILVEAGSTLADDDEARVERAQRLYQMLAQNPHVDQKKLVADVLVAFGKAREVDEYIVKETPGPPPEPPVKASMSVSTQFEMLTPEVQAEVLQAAGLQPPQAPQGPPPEMGPGGPGGPPEGGPGGPPPEGPPPELAGAPEAPPEGAWSPAEPTMPMERPPAVIPQEILQP